ncbi:acetyl-CoA acetyltransferase [Natronococcus amylolyticus DSM 10524]|uniref:Acetyl-CoA acetyltransferase n=1 Tax=Natronococcus amylolyticus DSM 10524 TaxID=1227497 RepID=L9X272_9EURY|nr:thiolase family protein [Natronococcus amylolyticus]ELY54688.1 acetyl-CoA acetyltransferase [Natronococcus amylolyticus DSM 10524]
MTGEIVVVDGARTPHGTLLGSLADVEAVELGRTALDGLLERTVVSGAEIDWVALGNAIQAGIGQVPGRQAVVESDLPNETPTTTVNEASGSGLRAIALAADRIAAGRAEFAVAGGFESMTNAPWILPDYRTGRRHGDATLKDSMIMDSLWDVNLDVHMGEITERLVDREGVSRDAQDEYALESHRLAAEAIESGAFDDEIVPVETGGGTIDIDEGPRPDSTLADLAELPTSFREDGTITPGNASKLSDGAGAVLLADADVAADHGLEPMARLADYELVYREPDEFNEAVGDVVASLLERNGLEADDVDAFWINEAFAAQSVYVMDRLGVPRERMNPRGGAVAFGHPIGASGGMLATSLAYQLRDEDVERGLVGMSVGGGGAIMALLERL